MQCLSYPQALSLPPQAVLLSVMLFPNEANLGPPLLLAVRTPPSKLRLP